MMQTYAVPKRMKKVLVSNGLKNSNIKNSI
jgi:hypothetical protein